MLLAPHSLLALFLVLFTPPREAPNANSQHLDDPAPVRTMWVGDCKRTGPGVRSVSLALAVHIRERQGDTLEATGWYPELGDAVTQFAGRLGEDGTLTLEETRVIHAGSDSSRGRVVAGAKYTGTVSEGRIVASGSFVDADTKATVTVALELHRSADVIDTASIAAENHEAVSPVGARNALFLLELGYEPDKSGAVKRENCSSVRLAFWVAPDLAVTSLTGLASAGSIETLEKRGKIKFAWVASDPSGDLALLRAKTERTPGEPVLELASADSGVPLDQQFLLFSSLRRSSPPELHAVADLVAAKAGTHPLLAGQDSMELGGLPLVDANGRLTGICAWAPAGTPLTVDRVLPVERVRSLLAAHAANTSSTERATLKGVGSPTSLAVPSLSWGQDASKLTFVRQTCREFADKIRCPDCSGKGYREEEYKDLENGRQVRRTTRVDCKKCDKDRLRDPKGLQNHARVVAAILSSAVTTEWGEETKASLENGARAASAQNPVEFAKRLNDAAQQALAPKNVVPGRSLMFIVPQGEWFAREFSPLGPDATTISLKEHNLILLSPDTRNVQGESAQVLIVGTTCGVFRTGGGSFPPRTPVRAAPLRPEGAVTGGDRGPLVPV